MTSLREVEKSVKTLPKAPLFDAEFKFNGANVTENNHNLHKYPAKYIPQFPEWGLNYSNVSEKSVVLDPFCGSGTTMIESGLLGHHSIGYDVSPLAVMISKAKTSLLLNYSTEDIEFLIEKIVLRSETLETQFREGFEKNIGLEYLGMHRTWSNWFRPSEISKVFSLRESIIKEIQDEELRIFALVCLSAVLKSCSFLSENQIKVRFDSNKKIKDPIGAFKDYFLKSAQKQKELGEKLHNAGAHFDIEVCSAIKLPLDNSSVDLIITSPPYINAVDYTMAHKYNLFALGLVAPSTFWNHSHSYIGVTERAVKAHHLVEKPFSNLSYIQSEINTLWEIGTKTSKNRSYVVSQYFDGMFKALEECNRVLRKNKLAIFVVGETNTICGQLIKTGDLIQKMALELGFILDLRFYHILNNRSSMRLNRGQKAKKIKREVILVLRKK